MWTRILLASLFACLMPSLARSQAAYVVTDLGTLSPTGINDWAQVVGNYNNEAYIWRLGHRRALGKLSGGTFSFAAAINDKGMVTGSADGPATIVGSAGTQVCTDVTQPFLWSQGTGMHGLGTEGAPEDPIISHWCDDPYYGTAINLHGEVVGHDVDEHLFDFQWAFDWTKSAGMSLFGGSWPPTFANGINFENQIVGDTAHSLYLGICCFLGLGHANSWKSGVATDLGTLGGSDAVDFASSATGINDWGQIVGWSTTASVPGADESIDYFGAPTHAVLWTPSGEIKDLGTLPGDTLSAAVKINFFGQVIGSSGGTALPFDFFNDYDVTGHPFIWTQQNGMRDLNTLIPSSGWVLTSATDINFWGQIVGEGTLNGKTHGYLLTPTNPFPVF